MHLEKYENEEFKVDEIQEIKEVIYFAAEDFKVREIINNNVEEFKVKEIGTSGEPNTVRKEKVVTDFNKKINQLKTTINSGASTTLATSMVVVTAAVGVGAVMPEIIENEPTGEVIEFGEIDFLNYTLDFNDETKLKLFFNKELEDGYYCIIVNNNLSESKVLEDNYVEFNDLDYEEYDFQIQIFDKEDEIVSTEELTINLKNHPYLGMGLFDYTITYNNDETTNLFISLDDQNTFNKSDIYLSDSSDNKLSYSPIYENNLICFFDIKEETFNIFGTSSYIDEGNNTHKIYDYTLMDVNVYEELEFTLETELNYLTITTTEKVESDLNVRVRYLDTLEFEEFIISKEEINGSGKTLELSRIVEEYEIIIEGDFSLSEISANINPTKGSYYKQRSFSKIVQPNIYSYVNLEKVEILNNTYVTSYDVTPTRLFFDGYIEEGKTFTVNVYDSTKTNLLDSIENITTLDEAIQFNDLDTSGELVFEYIISYEGIDEIKKEYRTSVAVPDEYLKPDYEFSYCNPSDVFITYNDDGTFNAYFPITFNNNSEYDIVYKIELNDNAFEGEQEIYQYIGSDSTPVIYNVPANKYGLYFSAYLIDGINYYAVYDYLCVSGLVGYYMTEEGIDGDNYSEVNRTNTPGIYEVTLYTRVYSDVEVEVILDSGETVNLNISFADLVIENDIVKFTIDLSNYSYSEASVKLITMCNDYYGFGDDIKERDIEIVGNESYKYIYEMTIY